MSAIVSNDFSSMITNSRNLTIVLGLLFLLIIVLALWVLSIYNNQKKLAASILQSNIRQVL